MQKTLAIIAQVNPPSYGVGVIRWSLAGVAFFSLSLDLIVLFLITIAIVFIGAKLFSKMEAQSFKTKRLVFIEQHSINTSLEKTNSN